MATLQQPLPLNRPPPQPASQPPRKKLRPRNPNAKPKLTLEQVTDEQVVQSALRIGRRARASAPNPGEESQALDKLLNRMAGWAHQVAPHYSLAEFVVAAQGIAGNRELRPMLGVFRLAELRDVTGDDGAGTNNHPDDVDKDPEKTQDAVQPGPIHADVGPVGADVGPEDDDWDELDIVPDETIQVRPVPNTQTPSPGPQGNTKQDGELSPQVEARIEKNRLAAIERRKAAMARLRANNATASPDKESDESLKKGNVKSDSESSARDTDAHSPSPNAPATKTQDTEAKRVEQLKPAKTDAEGVYREREMPDPEHTYPENGKDLSEKPKSVDDNRVEKLSRTLSEEKESEPPSSENEVSASKADKGVDDKALSQTESPKRSPQTANGPERTGEHKRQVDGDAQETEQDQAICKDKTNLSSLKESADSSGNLKNSHEDEDVDMEILAEFEAGEEE